MHKLQILITKYRQQCVWTYVVEESVYQYSQYLDYPEKGGCFFGTGVVVCQYFQYFDYSPFVCQYSQYFDYSPNMGGCLLGQMLWYV